MTPRSTPTPKPTASIPTIALTTLPHNGPSMTTRLWLGLIGALLLGAGIGGWFQLRRIRARRAAVRW